MANNHQVQQWRDRIIAIQERCHLLVANTTETEFNLKPAPDRWSVSQCIDHLNKVSATLIPGLEAALDKPSLNSSGEWQPGQFEKFFLKVVGPNPGFPVSVPKPYIPELTTEPDQSLEAFIDNHNRLIALLDKVAYVDVRKLRVPSPAMRLLRVSVGCWYESNIVHDNYHLSQAEAVLAEIKQNTEL